METYVGVSVTVPAFGITSDWSSPLITHHWLDLICPVDASDRDLSHSPDSCYRLWEICQLKEWDVGGRDPVCPWRRMETYITSITSCSDSLLSLVDLQANKSRLLQTSYTYFSCFFKQNTFFKDLTSCDFHTYTVPVKRLDPPSNSLILSPSPGAPLL